MRSWKTAWQDSLYGAAGFYTVGPGATAGPGGHFRTSVHVGPVFAAALARLLGQVDERLGRPDVLDLVDVGAGRGELLSGVLDVLPASLAHRVRATAVEVRDAPAGCDPRVSWWRGGAAALRERFPTGVRGLLVAHELLDNVPCDVVEVDATGVRRAVLVDDDGSEQLGPALADAASCAAYAIDAASCTGWLDRWWPVSLPGSRAEAGSARDELWVRLAGAVSAGCAVAVDYGHVHEQRSAGRYDRGTLVGYALGRQVPPVPDGRSDLTAHVAVDSCAAAVPGSTLHRQRDLLQELGVSGRLPPFALASDSVAYAAALQDASDAAELRDPEGLGGFWWLRHDVRG